MKAASILFVSSCLLYQQAQAQLNIVRIVPPGGTMRFSAAETQTLNTLPSDSKLVSLSRQAYVKRIGATVYCVSKFLPEFEELRDQLTLLTEIMKSREGEEVKFSRLSSKSKALLIAMLSGNRHHEIQQYELVESGKLEFLPKEFVDFKSDKHGAFSVMASPDIDSLTPEQKKTFFEKFQARIRTREELRLKQSMNMISKNELPVKQTDAIEKKITPEDALNGLSPYRGFEVNTNQALFRSRNFDKIHQTSLDLINEAKEIVRKECIDTADQFLPELYRIAPEIFRQNCQPATEKDIERYKIALKSTLEMDKKGSMEIDAILRSVKFDSRSVGLVMFINVQEVNGKIVTHTPMIIFR